MKLAFSRIIHGWTNYSTGVNATHNTDPELGDFATVASFYTQDQHVRPREFGVIIIWLGDHPQRLDFADFDFQFHICRLAAFTNPPNSGDIAALTFVAPTGGSVNMRDAPGSGPRDVQGSNLVSAGWQYIINLGGLTVYSGQLAPELLVESLPQLRIQLNDSGIDVAWPSMLTGYVLESSCTSASESIWLPLSGPLTTNSGWTCVNVSPTASAQFFRLHQKFFAP
jgi:hypothetical protein